MGRGKGLNVFMVVNGSLLIHLKQVGLVNHKVHLCPLTQHPKLVSNHSFLTCRYKNLNHYVCGYMQSQFSCVNRSLHPEIQLKSVDKMPQVSKLCLGANPCGTNLFSFALCQFCFDTDEIHPVPAPSIQALKYNKIHIEWFFQDKVVIQ